ncbi:MAG: hypothetical protein Kow0027_10110 [Saprospiraceae bacterium]
MTRFLPIFLFTSLTLATACSDGPELSGKIHLKAGSEWKSMVYLVDPGSWGAVAKNFSGTLLDSAAIAADGSFSFGKMPAVNGPVLLELTIQRKDQKLFPNRLEDENPAIANYMPFIWEPGKNLNVSADADAFQKTFTIENPDPENAAMMQLRDLRLSAFQQFLSENDADTHTAEGLMNHEEALKAYQSRLMEFAEESDLLLPALTAIRWVSPEVDYERVPEFLVAMAEKWQKAAPGHPWVQQLAAIADRSKLPVLIGDTIPDYPMPMLAGDNIPLRKMLASRLTILDLWASWCAPCRKENRNYLVPLWDKYHDQGFQIIGYALDAGRGAWTSAIQKDGADRWLHASDLNGDDSPFFRTLRINTIPANFLLDAKGKVVAKNLHGEELVEWVEEWMKN